MPIYRGFAYATLVAVIAFIGFPYLVLRATASFPSIGLPLIEYMGIFFFLLGFVFFYLPVYLFAAYGYGTPAPFDPPKKLVTHGIFGVIRNPMYLGVFIVLLGESLIFKSFSLLAASFVIWLLLHLYVIYVEEPALVERYGDEYVEYVISVPRWFPRVHRAEEDAFSKDF